jgi:hypothetical protein
MKYHVTKLDRRHAWHKDFAYMIEFDKWPQHEMMSLQFDRSLRWFNENFGWGQEAELRSSIVRDQQVLEIWAVPGAAENGALANEEINSRWTYSVKNQEYRIYTASEAELNWFVLSHPNET